MKAHPRRLIAQSIALALALIAAACGGWLLGGNLAPASATPDLVYDHGVATLLASTAVPAKSQEYFMFDLSSFVGGKAQAKKFAKAMQTANKEKKCLGIIGSSPAHNTQVLKQAVQNSAGKTLPNLTVIVVGPATREQATRRIAAPLAAQFRYFSYA